MIMIGLGLGGKGVLWGGKCELKHAFGDLSEEEASLHVGYQRWL